MEGGVLIRRLEMNRWKRKKPSTGGRAEVAKRNYTQLEEMTERGRGLAVHWFSGKKIFLLNTGLDGKPV